MILNAQAGMYDVDAVQGELKWSAFLVYTAIGVMESVRMFGGHGLFFCFLSTISTGDHAIHPPVQISVPVFTFLPSATRFGTLLHELFFWVGGGFGIFS